jgi:hypothetical protein
LLIGRLLHAPSEALRRDVARDRVGEAAKAEPLLRRLFGLDGAAAPESEDDR